MPTSTGRSPVNKLCDKVSKVDKEESRKISLGILPSNLLCDTSSSNNWVRFPMDEGIFPDSSFHSKYITCSFLSFPEESGMTPVK
ncbi:hypothetical protein TIFTF001_040621 [Ficus carica]|uniref:Uncharacterized protein n=1 Tax=Ficus carica TaxID=3494 RepID=A0AA87Z7X9_FICCA|nr:hypothetical protein TIFTF001_040429 [Ficus carica]GMN23279.1 hypothetical protein TIFTF001_040430 [Ficus carica]GMN24784.1 hypothetical protein TIFTF001_040620 [Ficus carica]GMN24796.1 hypothetical protein TIFTF001_040621 [Ficus carica]